MLLVNKQEYYKIYTVFSKNSQLLAYYNLLQYYYSNGDCGICAKFILKGIPMSQMSLFSSITAPLGIIIILLIFMLNRNIYFLGVIFQMYSNAYTFSF